MKRIKHLIVLSMSLALVVGSLGCERTPEDLEQWRTAKGGMKKMQEWAKSPEEPKPVRIRAVEILVEEGEANALQPTLEGVEDEKLRTEMVETVVPTVVAMYEKRDMPKLSEKLEEQGGAMTAKASESEKAKDVAYFLHPFAEGESKQKLEAILADWMSDDWQLRNQLGVTTLGQIAPRAGQKGAKHLVAWTEEAVQPNMVVEMAKEHGDDEIQKEVAIVLRKRAEEAHPDLKPSLLSAVMNFGHEELTPYYKKAITDDASSNDLIDLSMDALVRAEGKRASPFFTELVKNEQGLLRWVSATRLVEIMGKSGFKYVAAGLPVEMDSYPPVDKASLKEDTTYFCNMYQGEMKDKEVESVSDQLGWGLESSRWPARLLALQCARVFQAKDLKDQISKLESDDQSIPGWGERTTIGDIAESVLEDLNKS